MYDDLMDEDICNDDLCNAETEPEHKQMTLKDYWQLTTSTARYDAGTGMGGPQTTSGKPQSEKETTRTRKK